MAVQRTDFSLGVCTYHIRKYPPFIALQILGDLQKRFLGPMATFMEGQQGQEISIRIIIEGVTKISSSLDGDSIVALTKRLIDPEYVSVSIGSEPAEKLTENILNRAMDDVGDIIELLIKVLELNYKNVFTIATTRLGMGQQNGAARLVN
jgi:hypothetical protein